MAQSQRSSEIRGIIRGIIKGIIRGKWHDSTDTATTSRQSLSCVLSIVIHHHHRSLNREGHWGTTDDFATSFLHFFPVLHCPLGLGRFQACPFPDVVFPPLPKSTLSSSPFHCDLQDGFGQIWWMGDMTIPLQFASLYERQEVFRTTWSIVMGGRGGTT